MNCKNTDCNKPLQYHYEFCNASCREQANFISHIDRIKQAVKHLTLLHRVIVELQETGSAAMIEAAGSLITAREKMCREEMAYRFPPWRAINEKKEREQP